MLSCNIQLVFFLFECQTFHAATLLLSASFKGLAFEGGGKVLESCQAHSCSIEGCSEVA